MAAQYRTPSWYRDFHRKVSSSHSDHAHLRRSVSDNHPLDDVQIVDTYDVFEQEEDKIDDGIESVPSIRNLKSRFETKDSSGPVSVEHTNRNRSRSPYGGSRHSSGGEEQVGFITTTHQTSHPDYIDNTDNTYNVTRSRPPSKWDKPKEAPPPPVNREISEDEIIAAELPAVGTSKSIAEKFKHLEDDSQYSNERKPVRKMTPPRDELSRGIENAQREVIRSGEPVGYEEEELPPAEYTKSMLAKFKSLEDTRAPVPSPVRSIQVSSSVRRSPAAVQQHRQPVNRPSPDSGISDSESQPTNGGYGDAVDSGVSENNPVVLPDVVRESDRHDTEELPGSGSTRSLLAQWRNMEQTVHNTAGSSTAQLRPKSQGRSWGTSGSSTTSSGSSRQQHYDQVDSAGYENSGEEYDREDREIIRAGDTNPEDELPPASYTRNMLAKFKEMQDEAQREAANLKTPPPSKKQFKWTVKESRPLFKGRRDSSPAADRNGYHDVNGDEMDHIGENGDVGYDQHQHDVDSSGEHVFRYDDDVVRADEPVADELPAPATTRNALAVFKSMEDVNRPPPTPEYAKQQAKQVSPARTMSIRRGASPPPSHQYVNGHHDDAEGYHSNDEREHLEGGDYHSGSNSHDEFYRDYDPNGGEFESEPHRREDVLREDVTNEAEELPEQGTTKNLLAKFQSLTAI